jgi:hypothetical protein
LQAGLAHLLAGERRGALDLLLVLAVGADARDGDQVGQAADDRLVVLRQPVQCRFHPLFPLCRCPASV